MTVLTRFVEVTFVISNSMGYTNYQFTLILYGASIHKTSTSESRKEEEGNAIFNDALNTFNLRLYCVGHMETRFRHMGYSFRLEPSLSLTHQSWSTGWRNSSMGPP